MMSDRILLAISERTNVRTFGIPDIPRENTEGILSAIANAIVEEIDSLMWRTNRIRLRPTARSRKKRRRERLRKAS